MTGYTFRTLMQEVSIVKPEYMFEPGCRKSALQSLKDLGVDKVDLLLMHWPNAWTPESTNDSHQPDTTVTVLDTWCAAG